MTKSTEKIPPNHFAANNQHESSTQENRNDNQSKKSPAFLNTVASLQKEFEEFCENLDKGDKNEDDLKSIKKKIGNVRSSLEQYEKQRTMEKGSSSSQQRWLPESPCGEMSKYWEKLQLEKHILFAPMMSNLQISYDILPSHLRLSLLSFAVFPEYAIIKMRPMIYWWASEVTTKSATKTAQEAAEEIFQELIDKDLIQPWYKSNKPSTSLIKNCTVRAWIRRMLICIATRAQFFDFDAMGKVINNCTKSDRLCLFKDNNWSNTSNNDLKELLTIFNVNESYLTFGEQFFFLAKKLRVLQLGRWQASPYHHIEVENNKFLDELWHLKHLKYLSLRGISRISMLPSSIVGCRELEILDLKACHNLESLPNNVGSWRKLTHLDMSECYLLESMPNGLRHLISLQVLKGFIIGVKGAPTELKDLAHLDKLKKLSLLVTRKSDPDLVSNALSSFSESSKAKNLKNLTISWRIGIEEKKKEIKMDDKFLLKLEKLDLRCYPYRNSQVWMDKKKMPNLNRLYIRGGNLQEWEAQRSFYDEASLGSTISLKNFIWVNKDLLVEECRKF